MASWEESTTIARRLHALDPESADVRRDLAVVLERVGNARLGDGAVEPALAAYRESLALFRLLAAQDPEDAEAQRVVAAGLQRVGDALSAAGSRDAAEAAYAEGVDILRALPGPMPGEGMVALDLAIGLERLGDLRRDRDREAAAAAYSEAVEIRRLQAATVPDDASRQAAFAASLEKLGYVQAMSGDGPAAIATMEDIVAARRRLVELQPASIDAAWQLGEDLLRLGNLHLAIDAPLAALAVWQENLAVRERMANAAPDDAVRRRLAGAYANVAFGQLFAGDFAAAETAARQALELAPGEIAFATNLAHALMLQGEIEAANRLYRDHRGSDLGGRRWEDLVLDDFDRLRQSGVAHPHMAEIEALYHQPNDAMAISENDAKSAPAGPEPD